MVERISVACTSERRSSPRVIAAGSRSRRRDHSPKYIEGAYCAWIPPIRSSARGSGAGERSSSSWRASSARLRSRWVRVRGIGGTLTRHVTGPPDRARPVRPAAAKAVVHAGERRRHRRREDGRQLPPPDGRRHERPLAAPALVRLPGGDEGVRRHLLRPRRADPQRLLALARGEPPGHPPAAADGGGDRGGATGGGAPRAAN